MAAAIEDVRSSLKGETFRRLHLSNYRTEGHGAAKEWSSGLLSPSLQRLIDPRARARRKRVLTRL